MKNIVHFDLKCDNLLVNLGDPKRPICKVLVHKTIRLEMIPWISECVFYISVDISNFIF